MRPPLLCLLLGLASRTEGMTSHKNAIIGPQGCHVPPRPIADKFKVTGEFKASDKAKVVNKVKFTDEVKATRRATPDMTTLQGDQHFASARIRCVSSEYELSARTPEIFCVNGTWSQPSIFCVWKGHRLWRETDRFLQWTSVVTALVTAAYVITMVSCHKMADSKDDRMPQRSPPRLDSKVKDSAFKMTPFSVLPCSNLSPSLNPSLHTGRFFNSPIACSGLPIRNSGFQSSRLFCNPSLANDCLIPLALEGSQPPPWPSLMTIPRVIPTSTMAIFGDLSQGHTDLHHGRLW